ncbi:uncharacterized protein PSANT_02897 [Moesziomyces antarcticus]|nr:uncharacterized protein PSANT_02897 [Moesziomyces antarcticus]
MSDSGREAESARRLQAAAYRYNCQPCKQRKTKCDRVRPCASCQLRGTQSACYADDLHPTSNPTPAAPDEVEERPHKRTRTSEAAHAPTPPTHHSASAIRQHIALLRSTIDSLEAELGGTSEQSSPQRPIEPSGGQEAMLTSSLRLVWEDVKHLFPPPRDVDRILNYFLAEMTYIMIPVQEKQLWAAWQRLLSSKRAESTSTSGVSRCMVASLLVCLASTSFLIPKEREQQLALSIRTADRRDGWITSALALARSGNILPSQHGAGAQPWLNYVDAIMDTSLDRFGFETLALRIFNLLGMSEIAYHLTGESIRRALRVNLFDESSSKAAEAITYDDALLTPEDARQMRRRIGSSLIVIERWSSLYTGRPPMIDEEAETLPLPDKAYRFELEEITYAMSRYVSKLRLLPNQLTELTSRKAGDWRTQRQRDQEAVARVLELDRGLCSLYDPDEPMAYFGGRSCAQILAELRQLEAGHRMDDAELKYRHRQFAEALVLTSSWLSLRCLMTSNLMFLPWVGDPALRYYALNLARRLIELLPSIWTMASSAYVPFSSSWISRHVFLACTVLSVPILGQAHPGEALQETRSAIDPEGRSLPELGGEKLDFEPSRLQRAHVFSKLSADASRVLDSPRIPGSSSVDLDWFSGKLVEIAQLFSKLAERGDQTAAINTKLITALLGSRTELRDRVLHKLGQRVRSDEAMRPIESQRDLTTFVAAQAQSVPTPTTPVQQERATNSEERSALHDLASVVETVQEGSGWNLLDGFEQASSNKDHRLNNDALATVPLLDTADWLAILDGVDIPI